MRTATATLADAAYEVIRLAWAAGLTPDHESDLDDLCVDVAAPHTFTAATLLAEVRRLFASMPDEADVQAFDEDAPMDESPSYGPARLHDDDYYARNDAGEYAWM